MLQPVILTSADVSSVYVQLTVANVGPADMGHSWPGAISEPWGCILQRSRLLCPCL